MKDSACLEETQLTLESPRLAGTSASCGYTTRDTVGMPLSLRDVFGFEPDEKVVLSVCAVTQGDGWRLMHGTLLVVPEACAAISWGEWNRQHAGGRGPKIGPLPTSLSAEGDGWLMARAVIELPQADRWLAHLTEAVEAATAEPATVKLDGVHPVPALSAMLRAPKALLRALPGVDAPAGSLLAGLGRPAQALLWADESAGRFPAPQSVEVADQTSFLPSLDLTGIHVAPEGWTETPRGLLVGRAERRAWLREGRGDGKFESFLVDLGWDPGRISLPDLELTHEELLDGELVLDSRLRLEDLDTRKVDDLGLCTITLPTVGRSVAHSVALRIVDGELLDRSGPYPLVERAQIDITVNGDELPPVVTGISDPPPELDERMQRAAQIATELESVVRNGVQARMIADRQLALDRLTDLLKTARGELLVLDRYFGQSGEDWRLLDDVPVPVRVLCAKLEKDHVPAIAAHVSARVRPKAALHERIYVWDGSGLSVGGSPTTFGQGPVRITRLRQAEVDEWRTIFEVEWKSPLYRDVERAQD